MNVDLYDLLLFAGVLFSIYVTIKNFIKNHKFKNCKTVEGNCYEVRATRYNYIITINRFFYSYTVDGSFYMREDSDGCRFRNKYGNVSNPVVVEYLEDDPSVSRLELVNHNNNRKVILNLLFLVIVFIYLILRKNGIL